jgi:hypothetical protein
MICVDKNLINEVLKSNVNSDFNFSYRKLSNKFIDRLFNHYYVKGLITNFYDSEPDNIDSETCQKYFAYEYDISNEITEKCTKEELYNAWHKAKQLYKEYEPKRLRQCSWQDLTCKGEWGLTQKGVDKTTKDCIDIVKKKFPKTLKDRLYISELNKNTIMMYFYGRDIWHEDYLITFVKRKRRNK